MKIIDIEKKPRRYLYNLYKEMDYPYVGFTANIDVTNVYQYCKKNELSFFYTMMFLVAKICNEIEEFRYRIHADQVVDYEIIHPSYTILIEEDAFNFCTVPYTECFEKFYSTAIQKAKMLKGNLDIYHEDDRDDLIYITCIPWISFTHVLHPVNIKSSETIPRIAFGKYFDVQERKIMPVNVQANHSLIDGFHIGKFYRLLNEAIDNY